MLKPVFKVINSVTKRKSVGNPIDVMDLCSQTIELKSKWELLGDMLEVSVLQDTYYIFYLFQVLLCETEYSNIV